MTTLFALLAVLVALALAFANGAKGDRLPARRTADRPDAEERRREAMILLSWLAILPLAAVLSAAVWLLASA
jgi:phosphate/sulfate permease